MKDVIENRNKKVKVKVEGDNVILSGLSERQLKFFKGTKDVYCKIIYDLFTMMKEDKNIVAEDKSENEEEEAEYIPSKDSDKHAGMYN
ncbi:MAG: hypothetical protein QXL94_01955 [Candidatus Parvarchaeum sp.]